MVKYKRKTKLKSTTKPKVSTKVKPKVISLYEMEVGIAKYFGVRQNIIVPNISWGLRGMHECDVFILKKSGYAVEVEIKRSKQDLLADFKKKHGHIDQRISEFYYAIPKELLEICLEHIPENCGIITCETYKYKGKTTPIARLYREPKKKFGFIKLTTDEQFKIAKLGCMRIWTLKQKVINLQDEIKTKSK